MAYQQKEKQVYALDAFESDYKRLQTKIDRAKESLDSVHQRLRQINVDDTDMTFVHVLDVAKPSTTEVASGQSLRLATGLIVGLLLGAVLAWIRGLIDQRIRTAEEVRFGLRMPILAILPRGKKGATKEGQTVLERWDLDSHYAEAARSLRTAVYFGMTQLQGNCVQVTSPDSGDGKTTIAANLAIAMAKAGQRTLLIDCDMRKPRQAERFGLDLSRGLTNVLADNMPLTDAIQGTAIPELHVLGSGPVPANPAELLNTPEMARLLDEVGKQYDRVIVDSPPILPVADARILASKCHASILALRVDKSTRRRAAAGRDALSAVGAKILGVALNDMPSGIGYGYGYGYGRYGSYGYGEYGDDRRPASYPDVGETENQKSVTGGLTGSQPAQAPRSRRSRRREPS